LSSIATNTGAKREQRPKTAKAAAPTRVRAAGSGATKIETGSRAAALTERLRKLSKERRAERRRPRHTLDGTFRQASADGAVEWAEQRLARRIRAHLTRGALNVTLTDNRYTMISVRRDTKSGPSYRVRLHHMFADANPSITRALAHYIGKNDSSASRVLGDYIDGNQHRVRMATRKSKRVNIDTKGEFHDLQELFDDINQRYFDGKIEAVITWGQRTGKRRRRNSIKMGSYSVEEKLIRRSSRTKPASSTTRCPAPGNEQTSKRC
jgi:hypothetical protein